MKQLFKNKSFVLLFQGALVSMIGTSLYGFAAGIYVLSLFPQETYGNAGAVYFSIVSAAPIVMRILLSPLAGALVDKWKKIRIIYLTDFINGILFFMSLYVLTQFNLINVQQVLLFVTIGSLAGISSSFFGPAVQSSIPDIVGDDLIQAANGAQSIISSIQGIIGVLAGVILYELVGIEVAILANAISFIISGISEMFIKTKYLHPHVASDKHIVEDIKVGFKYIKNTTGLMDMLKYVLIINFAFTPVFSVGVPFLFNTQLGKSGYHLATTSIIFSIAMLVAGLYIGSKKISSTKEAIRNNFPKMVLMFVVLVLVIFAITYGWINYYVFLGLYIVIIVLTAFYSSYVNIPINTALVKGTDPSYRGRVLSVIQSLSSGAVPLSLIVGGLVIQFSNVAFLGLFCVFVMLYPFYGIMKNNKVTTYLEGLDQPKIVIEPEVA